MNADKLYGAAVLGDFARVQQLLAQDAALVNQTDEYGFTPLHGVVGEHHFDMAALLIDKGAHVDARNDEGISPLHLAAYPEMVDILMAHGAVIEARDVRGNTPLHLAAESAEGIHVVERLLIQGADINARNHEGLTALGIAMVRQDDELAALLKNHGGRGSQAVPATDTGQAAERAVVDDPLSDKPAQKLRWFEYVWAGWPLLLFTVGGALGGLCGGAAMGLNVKIFLSAKSTPQKYGLTLLVSLVAVLFYVVTITALVYFFPSLARR
ncbi:ankyrin repeat domain-containing protein [Ottowia sp.]|uniref:ankyrin repeat domain-containing protein n=1 Tax=Ottowia sp. TaxID=1898956 RepID=UPI003A879F6E